MNRVGIFVIPNYIIFASKFLNLEIIFALKILKDNMPPRFSLQLFSAPFCVNHLLLRSGVLLTDLNMLQLFDLLNSGIMVTL